MANSKQTEPDSNPDPEESTETESLSESEAVAVSPVDDGFSLGEDEIAESQEVEPEVVPSSFLTLDPESILVAGSEASRPRNQRRHGPRKWIKRILIGVPVAVLGMIAIVVGLLYFAGDHVVEKVWPIADRKLSDKGIFLSWDSVEQTKERGIILENVVIFRDLGRNEPLLTIGNVATRFTWGHDKIGGGPGARVTLDQSGVLLDTGAGRNQLTDLQGSIAVNAAGLAIEQLQGQLNGLRMDVAGDLKWSSLPSDESKQGAGKKDRDRAEKKEKKSGPIDLASMDFSPIDQALDWIQFSGKGAPILLSARFSGPEDQPISVDVSLKGSDFIWREVPIDVIDLGARGQWGGEADQAIRIAPLQLGYRGGMLKGEATFDSTRQRLVISSLDSNLDLAGLAAELHPPTGEKLKAYHFSGPPEIALTGTLTLKDFAKSVINGVVNLPRGLIAELGLSEPLVVSGVHSGIAMKNGTVSTQDFHLDLPGGRIEAELTAKPFAESLEFEGQVKLVNHAVGPVARLFGVKENVDDVVSMASSFSGTPGRIQVSSFKIDQGDRSMAAVAVVDLDAGIVEVTSLKSNFDLPGLASRIHPATGKSLALIRFPAPPEFDLSGTLSLAEISKSSLKGSLKLPGGIVLGQDTVAPLEISEFSTEFAFLDEKVVAKKFHLGVFGGAIDGVITSNPFAKPLQFSGTVDAKQLSLASISRIFRPVTAGPDAVSDPGGSPEAATVDSAVASVESEIEAVEPVAEKKRGAKIAGALGAVQDVAAAAVTKSAEAVGAGAAMIAGSEEVATPAVIGNSLIPDRIDLAAEFEGAAGRIEIGSLKIDNGDRALTAQAIVDLEQGILEISSLDSNLDLVGMAKAAHPPSRESFKTIAFGGGPVIQMSGTFPWKTPQQAILAGSVNVPEGLTLTLSEAQKLAVNDFSSTLKLEGGTFSADDLTMRALGGLTRARVIAKPFEDNLPLGLALQSQDLSLAEISRISGSDKAIPGKANFTLQGNGHATLTGFNGQGDIDIKNTELYFLPIIGKLFDQLNSLNFGLKKGAKSTLTATYTFRDGVFASEDLKLKVDALEVDAPGQIDLGRKVVDMKFRTRPSGVIGTANRLSGVALEISAKGPFGDISYGIGGNISGAAMDLVNGVAGRALEQLNGVVKPAENGGAMNPDVTESSESDPENGPTTEDKKGLLKKLNLFRKN